MIKRKQFLLPVLAMSLLVVIVAGMMLGGCAPEIKTEVPPEENTTETEASLPPPPKNELTHFDFVYDGDYLTCETQESVLGIDVSSWQGNIDWQQVKEAGIEFAMIRVGGRGYGESGNIYEDKYAKTNYEEATAAGIKVGVYFFSQAITVEEAKEEAAFVLDMVKDWDLQMPIAFDWECLASDYRTVGLDSQVLTDCAKAFCEAVRAEGYDTMIYFNPEQSRYNMHLEELVNYGFWLAMYSEMTYEDAKFDMWQYTKEGSVPGIKGNVDINLYFPQI